MSRLSWRTKLLALFTLVLGALLLFQLFYIIPNFQDREVEMTIAKQEEISYHIAREVDIDLFRIEDRLKRIAKLPEFYNMDIDNQHSIMVQHEDISLLISSLFVLDDKGWFICGNLDNISVYTTCSYADKPYFFVPFEQDEVYFGPPQFYSRSELMATSISVPIKSETGERIGVLLAGMRLNGIIENIANYPLDNETIAYLVDREGTVIAHSKIDVFSLEEGPLSLVGCNSSLVQDIMKGEKSGFYEYYHGNVAYYGAFSTLESNGWGVVVGAPKHVVLAETNKMTRWLLSVSIMIFVITFAITMVFSRQIMLEQKQADEKLEIRSMELEVASKTKSEFLANMSHELRTPLNSIIGFSEVLHDETFGPVNEKQSKYLSNVLISGKHLLELINGILDLAKVESGKMELVCEDFEVSAVVDETIMLLSSIASKKNIVLSTSVGQELTIVHADLGKFKQILYNLMSNAIKFTPKGGSVTVDARCVGDMVRIAVSDTGIGISKEDQDKLFEPFMQADASTSREFGGTGLGLALVKRFVEMHGGRVWIESDPDRGSTFIFTIPIKKDIIV